MREEQIKELIERELKESGFMYALGILRGMYECCAIDVEQWTHYSAELVRMNVLSIS